MPALFTLDFCSFLCYHSRTFGGSTAFCILFSLLSFSSPIFLCARAVVAGRGGKLFLTGGVKIRIFPAQDGLRSNWSWVGEAGATLTIQPDGLVKFAHERADEVVGVVSERIL